MALPAHLDKTSPSHYIDFHVGQSRQIFGTSDIRMGAAVGYGFGREDPKLRWKSVRAQLVHFVYYSLTSGTFDPSDASSIGYTALARYRFRTNGQVGAYVDFGWGIQYTDKTSEDIESHLNSTPYIGFGTAWKVPEGELFLGIGWFHISNGGLVPPNHSQNYLHLSIGIRY